MSPQNIFLLRHGESIGNKNKEVYKTTPDYALTLTELGEKQADNAGQALRKIIPKGSVQFYVSPYWRTRQTFLKIQKYFPSFNYYEDPRLREQEWSQDMITDRAEEKVQEFRDNYGVFYYRFRDGGESSADVYDRMSDFLDTMFRDFTKPHFADNAIIVSHGMAIRVFLMRFFHCTVEEFESWRNPENGEYFHLQLCKESGKYSLLTPMRVRPIPRNKFQFNWGKTDLENLGCRKLAITER